MVEPFDVVWRRQTGETRLVGIRFVDEYTPHSDVVNVLTSSLGRVEIWRRRDNSLNRSLR